MTTREGTRGPRRGAGAQAARLRRLSLRLLAELEEQATAAARTLHDDIGQALVATNLGLFRLARRLGGDPEIDAFIGELRRELVAAGTAANRLRERLRPASPTSTGALDAITAGEIERCGIEFGVVIEASIATGTHRCDRDGAALMRRIVRLAIREATQETTIDATIRIRVTTIGPDCIAVSIDGDNPGVRDAGARHRPAGAGGDELRDWIDLLEGTLRRMDPYDPSALLRLEFTLPD